MIISPAKNLLAKLSEQGIALLLELAERGEINPWDVQVIDVIDRVLNEVLAHHSQELNQGPFEADLSQSGQAFLYASMLVLLKADSLARSETDQVEGDALPDTELLDDSLSELRLPLHLERQLRRRAVAQPPRQRQVTLKELIDQLQLMAAALEEPKLRSRTRRPRPQSRTQTVRAIAQLAHQENLAEIAAELEQFLTYYWPQIAQGETWLELDHLLELWADPASYQSEPVVLPPASAASLSHSSALRSHHDRVGVFWALLFLSAQSKVELAQEEFYQDLKIRSLVELEATETSGLLGSVLVD